MNKKREESIVLVETYKRLSTYTKDTSNKYLNYPIHALEGLHDFVGDRIKEHFPPGGRVLDLGAGSGAMSARLKDLMFDVTAVDIVPENFRLHKEIPFVEANLNGYFSEKLDMLFDGIVAVEIIEHVENPRNFFRQCVKLLKSGGYFIVTTPNIDDPVSKSLFVRKGTFRWFSDDNYAHEGHITPISQWLFKNIIAETAFDLVSLETFGDPYVMMKRHSKGFIFAKILQLLSRAETSMSGQIMVAVCKRK